MGDLRVPDLNTATVAGRLVRDPELKYTQGGKAVCNGTIANTRYFKGADGERKEETAFLGFQCWGNMAEYVGERLKKGRPVIVEGRLAQQEWEDRTSGQKRTKTYINATRISPLDWDDDRQGEGQQRQQQPQGRPAPDVRDGQHNEELPDDDIPF